MHQTTICAIATPPGVGAISVIRISGPEAFAICDGLTSKKISEKESHTIHFCRIFEGNEIIDEVLISIFRAPRSYTGEDSIEISCHSSIYIQQKILELLIRSGARMAQPGEFTLRAFLNGKLDLSQAEAVADLIASQSESSHKVAMNQMRGGFSSLLSLLRERLLHFISLIELELDFSEEDVEFADRKELSTLLNEIKTHIDKLIRSFNYGNVLKNGVPVAIAGNTNVGKSTLLNALLNEEKAIVSDIAGTTRDVIEDTITIEGVLFRFIDTAGIRHTTDTIENLGIERTYDRIKKASIILYVADALENPETIQSNIEKLPLQQGQSLILIVNKIDKLSENEAETLKLQLQSLTCPAILLSAKNNGHIIQLQKLILTTFNQFQAASDVIVTNVRHYEALQLASTSLDRAFEGLSRRLPTDLVAQDIREILFHIGEITGEITNDEILGNIFKNFCIGK